MGFYLKHGDPLMVDYTPSGADVGAGEVVVHAGRACISHNPIADGELGSVAWPCGRAVYGYDGTYAGESNTWQSEEGDILPGGTLYVETGGSVFSNASSGNFAVGVVTGDIESGIGLHLCDLIHGG